MANHDHKAALDAPRWLLPLVAALHLALGAILIFAVGPLMPAAPRSLEVALLAPPVPARTAPPQPSPARSHPETKPAPATQSPAPAPLPSAPVAAPSIPAAPAPEARPAQEATPVVSPPRFDAAYLNNPRPAYPPLARRMGEEGRTVLRVLVSAEGLPEQIELRESAGSPRLDTAAQEAVRRWRFVPARQGDRAVAAWVLVPLVFKLEN